MDEIEQNLDFQLPTELKPIHNSVLQTPTIQDGQDVLNFLRSGNVTESLYDDYQPRPAHYPPDVDFHKPQVTRESLIQDGMDIVAYLRLNRYHADLESPIDGYDVNSILKEFECSIDEISDSARLKSAVDRLSQLQRHLSK